jgi:hypothetical protein
MDTTQDIMGYFSMSSLQLGVCLWCQHRTGCVGGGIVCWRLEQHKYDIPIIINHSNNTTLKKNNLNTTTLIFLNVLYTISINCYY